MKLYWVVCSFIGVCADRRYTDKHEWVHVNGKIGTVGISHYAQVI